MPDIFKRHLFKAAAASVAMAGGPAAGTTRHERAAIVLVHGGWHGAWCYERLLPLLAAGGAVAVARDLPGHGLGARFPASYGRPGQEAAFLAERSPLAEIGRAHV